MVDARRFYHCLKSPLWSCVSITLPALRGERDRRFILESAQPRIALKYRRVRVGTIESHVLRLVKSALTNESNQRPTNNLRPVKLIKNLNSMKTNFINSAFASITFLLITGCGSMTKSTPPSATVSNGEWSATISPTTTGRSEPGSGYDGIPVRNLPDSR